MTLLDRLGESLPERYYLGIDVGYKAHVAAVISLETFVQRGDRWKRARCLEFPSTRGGLIKIQRYLDEFSTDPSITVSSSRTRTMPRRRLRGPRLCLRVSRRRLTGRQTSMGSSRPWTLISP